MKKQLLADVLQNRCSYKFRIFHRKTPVMESLLDRFGGPQACNFTEKRLYHRCFPVKFVKFLRTAFLTEHLWWLILTILSLWGNYCNGCHSLCCFFCQPVNRNQVFSTFKHVHELRHVNKLTGLYVINDVKTEVL